MKQLQFHRPQSALSIHRETLEAHLREHPPQTINEAVAVLETLTGCELQELMRLNNT